MDVIKLVTASDLISFFEAAVGLPATRGVDSGHRRK